MDMSAVIEPKSDQINADDLIAGPLTFTIRDVQIRAGQEQPVSIVLEGTPKVYRPCKSMSRVLVAAWGPDASKYIGRALTFYRDPTVKWAGMEVGGIRISHMSHLDGEKQMMLTATKGSRKPHKVLPLVVEQVAEFTIDDARREAGLAASCGTSALETLWRQRRMAPHRDALAGELAHWKSVAANVDQAAPRKEQPDATPEPAPQD